MLEGLVIGILGGLLLIEIVRSEIRERSSARERRDLYSRIQAHDLGEYEALTRPRESPAIPAAPESEQKERAESSLRMELPTETVAGLRADLSDLMSGVKESK